MAKDDGWAWRVVMNNSFYFVGATALFAVGFALFILWWIQ